MRIPIPYQIIMDKVKEQMGMDGKIETHRLKTILTYRFHFHKTNSTRILCEMKELGLIEFENHKMIVVKS